MASVLDAVKYYQQSIEKHTNDEEKILKCIDKLFHLDVTTQHLQETGVGRTVNALRKDPGEVGTAARSLVYKWKRMVAAEESDHEGDHRNDSSMHNGNGSGKESDDNSRHHKSRQEQYERSNTKSSHTQHRQTNGHSTENKRKYHSSEDEEPTSKKKRHNVSDDDHKRSVPAKQENLSDSESDDDSDSSESDSDSYTSESSREDKHSKKETKPEVKMEKERTESPEKHKHHKNHQSHHEDHKRESSSKRQQEPERHSNNSSKSDSSRHTSESSKSSSHKHKSSHEKENSSDKKHKSDIKSPDEKKESKESNRNNSLEKQKSSSHKQDSVDKYKSSSESQSKEKSERHRSSDKESDKNRSTSQTDKEKDKQKSSSHTDKESEMHKNASHTHRDSEKRKSSSERESSKHRSKESSSSSSKDKQSSSSKEKSKDRSSHSEKKSSSDSKSQDKGKHERSEDRSEKKSKEKSSSSHKSKFSSKSNDEVPKKKSKKSSSEVNEEGIDCGSGASFAEALGMIVSPTKPKKKSYKDFSPSNPFSNDLSPAALLAPTAKLAPLMSLEISALPEISPHYKPRPPPKAMPHFTDEEALSASISSKNQRTKVYSGNKTIGKVSSLYAMCVGVLQEHIDALEYTGGVPYDILKPVIDRATPNQLFVLEHYNPYLMDDTDHLWQKNCEKNFRNKKRQEMETWREMYMRCQEEQESKLKSLTANIRMTQEAKKAPIKQTKMAYVDNFVKPPRNIARKQAIHGTAHSATASPAARVASLASGANVLKGGAPRPPNAAPVSSTSFNKPKKAPLMQKALQFMRGRKR